MRFWFKLALAYMVGAIALIWLVGKGSIDGRTLLDLVLLAASFLPPTIRHTPRLYLELVKLRYWITNHETKWRVSVQLTGAFASVDMDALVQRLVSEAPGSTLLQGADRLWLIQYKDEVVLKLHWERSMAAIQGALLPAKQAEQFTISTSRQNVSFRGSRRMLEEAIVPLCEGIIATVRPESGTYTLDIEFDGANPFIGLYLEQLAVDKVRAFSLECALAGLPADSYVRISLNGMTVVTSSLDGLRRGALMCLGLSSVGRR